MNILQMQTAIAAAETAAQEVTDQLQLAASAANAHSSYAERIAWNHIMTVKAEAHALLEKLKAIS